VIRLRSLAPLNDVELDLISFVQTLVAIDLNGAVMNEDVCSAFAPEKAVAFRVVEPLHRTLELCQLSALLTLVGWAAGLGSGIGLGLPKVDVECAGMTQTDLFPRDVCLLRKEDVSLFYFGHNIRVSWDFPMMDAFAVDHLSDLEDARGRALEALAAAHSARKSLSSNPSIQPMLPPAAPQHWPQECPPTSPRRPQSKRRMQP